MDYLKHSFESPVVEHWGFGKGSQKADHKYIDRKWVNGKWQYIYNTAQKGAKAVGGAASSVGNKISSGVREISKSSVGQKVIGGAKSAYKASETKLSELKTIGASALASGKKFMSDMGTKASTKVGDIKTSGAHQIANGKRAIMKLYNEKTGANHKKLEDIALRNADRYRQSGAYDRMASADKKASYERLKKEMARGVTVLKPDYSSRSDTYSSRPGYNKEFTRTNNPYTLSRTRGDAGDYKQITNDRTNYSRANNSRRKRVTRKTR